MLWLSNIFKNLRSAPAVEESFDIRVEKYRQKMRNKKTIMRTAYPEPEKLQRYRFTIRYFTISAPATIKLVGAKVYSTGNGYGTFDCEADATIIQKLYAENSGFKVLGHIKL